MLRHDVVRRIFFIIATIIVGACALFAHAVKG